MDQKILRISAFLYFLFILTSCNLVDDNSTSSPTVETNGLPTNSSGEQAADESYPSPTQLQVSDTAYPNPITQDQDQYLDTQPDLEQYLPQTRQDKGIIGGLLVEDINDEGFVPFSPYELILAEIINDSSGNPGLMGFDEDSPRAQIFPTGIFIFDEVTPGRYGFVVNLAIATFPLANADGNEIIVTVDPGSVIDLGQIIVEPP